MRSRQLVVMGCWVFGMVACTSLVQGGATPLTTELVADGLVLPLYVTHAPNDNDRVFIVEKIGRIRILTGGTVLAAPFLDIEPRVGGGAGGERGLLGLTFHPDYSANGFFYVNYTNTGGNTVIARYQVSTNADVADENSEFILLTIAQPQTNHNGGWLDFGPDGMLYIATGDGGASNDSGKGHTAGTGNAQDITDNLLGKILRIDVDGGSPFAIPPDNPFVGATGDDEIWSFGLRNPWRCAFDQQTGELFIADVGQNLWEEINVQPAGSAGGENWGWRCREGMHDFNTQNCGGLTLIEPIHEYDHEGNRCSITGGEVYRGLAIPDLRGTYFFADFCSGQIWSFQFDGDVTGPIQERTAELAPAGGLHISFISSFGRDARGELYICDMKDGEVYKIVRDPRVPTVGDWGLIVLSIFVLIAGSMILRTRQGMTR